MIPVLLFSTSPTTSQAEVSARDDPTPLRHRCRPSITTAPFPSIRFVDSVPFCGSGPTAVARVPYPAPQRPPQPLFHSCRLVFIRGSCFSLSPNIATRSVSEGRYVIETPLQPIHHDSIFSMFVLWILCHFVASVKLPPLKGLPLYLLFMRRRSSPMPCAG